MTEKSVENSNNIKLPFSLKLIRTEYFNRYFKDMVVDSITYEELKKIVKEGKALLKNSNAKIESFGISINKFDIYNADVYINLSQNQFKQLEEILVSIEKKLEDIKCKDEKVIDTVEEKESE